MAGKDRANFKRQQGESYRKSDDRYVFRKTVNGKTYCCYAKDLKTLRIAEKKILQDIERGLNPDGKTMTFDEMFGIWFEQGTGWAPLTKKRYQACYNNHIKATLGHRHLAEIKKTDILCLYNQLAAGSKGKKGKKPLSDRTIQDSIHSVIYQVLETAVDDGYIFQNPSKAAKKSFGKSKGAKTPKPKEGLEENELKAFLGYVQYHYKYKQYYPLFLLMFGTGMRAGEVFGLCWNDIDFTKNIITVSRQLQYYKADNAEHCTYHIASPKSEAGNRKIPLLASVGSALLEHRQRCEKLGIKYKGCIDGYSDFVFLNTKNTPWYVQNLDALFNRIVDTYNRSRKPDEIELPHISCHILRHTYTNFLVQGVSVTAAKSFMGHQNVSTTIDVYTNVNENFLAREVAKANLNQKFSELITP